MTTAFTITTFNILAPVHRSMGSTNQRESEREDWWRPRAEAVAKYISENMASSDIILLQEWWFDEKFSSIFDSITGDRFDRVAERRPGSLDDSSYKALKPKDTNVIMRDDGMCCLINKKGKLDIITSEKVLTGPQRIAQIVHCKERNYDEASGGAGRDVFIANTHLSFPKDSCSRKNDRRQAYEINLIQRALWKASRRAQLLSASKPDPNNEILEIICGDFNSEPNGFAASQLESKNFVNCASAIYEDIGVTHFTHDGCFTSVDHIFVRSASKESPFYSQNYVYSEDSPNLQAHVTPRNKQSALSLGYQDPLSLGYIDTRGTKILDVRSDNIKIKGRGVLSDHRPVTATLRWPKFRSFCRSSDPFVQYSNSTMPLDPLSYLCSS